MAFRLKQFLIGVDQLANVCFGSGYSDETISSYLWREKRDSLARTVVDILFAWEYEHCKKSYESELERRQLPPEMR